jgi:RNA polymerase sigma factor (sigma-70 family)
MIRSVDGVSEQRAPRSGGLRVVGLEPTQRACGIHVVEVDGISQILSAQFVQFYQEQYPNMVRLATLLTGSNETGEDITQEAFLALSLRFSALENPSAYLRKSVVNATKRLHRDRKRRLARLQLLASPTSTTSNPYDRVELADWVSALPFRQRVVVVGRYWVGWSETELAELLGCRPGTVKSLASRGLASLHRQIEEGDQ